MELRPALARGGDAAAPGGGLTGGATLEAVEAVSGGDPETFANVEVRLDQSLPRQDAERDRFLLLGTIREYAAEQASLLSETYELALSEGSPPDDAR